MQHNGKLIFFVVGLGFLFTLIFSACGPTPTTTGGNTPKPGGTVVDGLYRRA